MNTKQKIIYIYFLILPFLDLATSLITRFTNLPLSIGMIIKGLTILYCIIHILFIGKSKYKNKSIIYLITIFLFAMIYLYTKNSILNSSNLITEITYAFRYLYFPIMLIGLINVFDDFNIDKDIIKKILFINCICYTALLLIPYITGTGFNSYRYSSVKGENGWFYAANETGTIMVLLLSSIYIFINSKKKYSIFLTIPILLSIVFIGTKVSYFGMIIVVLLSAIVKIVENVRKKEKDYIKPIILLTILIVVCSFSPTIKNLEGNIYRANNQNKIKEEKNEVENDYKYNNIDELIKNDTIAKIVKISLNGRDKFFLHNYSIYTEAPTTYKLFGLGWNNQSKINYNIEKKLIEIDYLDILIHYGIIGFIVYFMPLFYLLFKIIKNRKLVDLKILYYLIIFLLGIAISSFAGHVLAAPAVSIYLVLILLIIIDYMSQNNNLNDKEITILSLHLNYGGIEQYIASLCKMLEDDYKINILCTYKILEKPAFEFSDKINITYLINEKPNKEELKKAIHSKKINSIIQEGLKSIKILYLKYSRNIKAIKKINSKYVITTRTFHNNLVGKYANKNIVKIATEHNYHNNNDKYINKIIKSLINFDYFIVVSEELKQFYANRINKNTKCIFIPNVIDNLPQKSSDLKENVLINIGRLEPEKGQEDLIDIIYEIKKEINDIKLFLIGDGSLKDKLKEKVKEKKLEENIIFTGFISKKEMEKYLLKSKIFVMTSYTESFGLVLIESMSYKIPCIAFDSASGARELLKNDNGILVPNRDKDEIVRQIIELLKNKKTLKKYSDNGYKKCQEYLIENVKRKWLDIIK